MLGKKSGSIRLVAVAIAMLAIGSVAYAAFVVEIDTDDGVLDTRWGAEPPLIIDFGGQPDATPNFDILEAWVGTDPTGSAYYFRVTLVGALQPDYSVLEARLDCNRNGLYQDLGDMIVYYQLNVGGAEEVVECQGIDYWDCAYRLPTNTSDLNPDTFGEGIPGTPTNYEWKGELTTGDANWSECLGTINVQFAALDPTGFEQDVTDPAEYIGIPTVVDLATFTATAEDRKVLLNWETASELDLLGFNLHRAEAEDGPQTQLNAELIPGQAPGSPEGAVYEFVDEVVQPGTTYWYWLEGLDAQGAPTLHGPVSATVPATEPLIVSHRIYLPLVHK
jgi:hypothetical protein